MKQAVFLLLLLLSACSGVQRGEWPIVIIYDNDVHCAVDGYAKVGTIVKSYEDSAEYQLLVSAGDFVHGDVMGSITHGQAIVDIMNTVGYDYVVPGNHEFDYGVEQLLNLTDGLRAEMLCSNFHNIFVNELPFRPYRVVQYGDVSVAFIGVTTTACAVSVAPKTFCDDEGNLKYHFYLDSLYLNTQKYIDEVRKQGADHVVVLSHLGDVYNGVHPTSIDLITHTCGIDVVIDGHAHNVIIDSCVYDKSGNKVLLTSSGTRLENVGVVKLHKDGRFTSELVNLATVEAEASLVKYIESVKQLAMLVGERSVGVSECDLPIEAADGSLIPRYKESGIGNLCTDAFRIELQADIAIMNGGAIRNELLKGELTYNDLYSVLPYNNQVSVAEITGKQLLDALEYSASYLPIQDGNFLQVSGLSFTIDTSIPSPVIMGVDGVFSHVGGSPRRVSNVKVLNAEGEYVTIESERKYTLASINYLIKDSGAGGILRATKLLQSDVGSDIDILERYIMETLKHTIPASYANPAGRINIKD